MGKILGLDIGTNSIGWALIEDETILGMGSRIVPMGADKIDYEKGIAITKNADRRVTRSIRKMNKRYKQRRNKLLYILSQTGLLPDQFKADREWPEDPKELQKINLLPIKKNTNQKTALQALKLRCDALEKEISLKDLGKIIYGFNQLRGYNGGSTEEETKKKTTKEDNDNDEDEKKLKRYEYRTEKFLIKDVAKLEDEKFKSRKRGEENKEFNWYEIIVTDTEEEEITGKTQLQDLKTSQEAVELQLKITNVKKGEPKYEFSLPKETDWKKKMKAFDESLHTSGNTPGQEFYRRLSENKWEPIRRQVVLRHRYQKEFDLIWNKQAEFHEILNNCPKHLLEVIAGYIFPGKSQSQEELREKAVNGGLYYIIREQIIYYQRELKSQEDLIGGCQFETELDYNNKPKHRSVPVSHPLYQEFRIWDRLNNLYITTRAEKESTKKGKSKYYYFRKTLETKTKVELFEKLQEQKEIKHSFIKNKLELNDENKFLNGLHFKATIKGNETLSEIRKSVGSDNYIALVEKDNQALFKLWAILYHGKGNEYDENSPKIKELTEVLVALLDENNAKKFALKLAQEVSFPRKYGNISEEALNKILPLIRCGKDQYYDYSKIPIEAAKKIESIRGMEIPEGMNEKLVGYLEGTYKNSDGDEVNENIVIDEGGMQTAFAIMLIYGSHTGKEIKAENSYQTPSDIVKQIKEPKKLRNPIVEQMLNETLHIVKDVWNQFGEKPSIIKVELARELKNSAAERAKIFDSIIKNEKNNKRIKDRLRELKLPINNENILKYKLCEQQTFTSPYTGKPIPMNDDWGLFSGYYDIDHIIPKSRFFDDSTANKVVCERHINEDKGNRTAWEYINIGSSIYPGQLMTDIKFVAFVEDNFRGRKKANLLRDKIPDNFVERQIKDTQYIAKEVKKELAKVVGNENIKTTGGSITDYLRAQWGLRKLLMLLTQTRYEQLSLWANGQNWVTNEYQLINGVKKKVYEIKHWNKRHDNRHHAIDALVVALTEQKHIYRLNNLNKVLQDWLEENKEKIKLERKEEETLFEAFLRLENDSRNEVLRSIGESLRKFNSPFIGLIEQAKKHLEKMIIAHKPKETLLVQKDEKGKLALRIRGALHNETLYGRTKSPDGEFEAEAYRIPIEKLTSKNIEKVVSETLKKELLEHKGTDSFKDAFSGERLSQFNEKRKLEKKPPVYAIRMFKEKGIAKETTKILNRERSFNNKQSVESGSNYCLVVLEITETNKKGESETKREFKEISFFEAAQKAKTELEYNNHDFKRAITDDMIEKYNANRALFLLMQNDLVYLPTSKKDSLILATTLKAFQEIITKDPIGFSKRVYKVVKITDGTAFFIHHTFARPINIKVDLKEDDTTGFKLFGRGEKKDNLQEFGSYNEASPYVTTSEWVLKQVNKTKAKTICIQDTCIKIQVDRLGNISPAANSYLNKEITNDNNILSEPEAVYQKRNLKLNTASSLEDMNEANAKAMAQLSGEEHLQNTTELIKRVYANELKKPMDKQIKFKE
jgi:CRISPR-associated endonuclease Csn1